MVKIEVGFEPHPFEKALVEQTKDDIQNRLHGHEFGRFKIVLKKPPQSQQIALTERKAVKAAISSVMNRKS